MCVSGIAVGISYSMFVFQEREGKNHDSLCTDLSRGVDYSGNYNLKCLKIIKHYPLSFFGLYFFFFNVLFIRDQLLSLNEKDIKDT